MKGWWNLSPGEKLAMMEDFKEEVRIENEKKKLATLKQNQAECRSLQLEGTDEEEKRNTWTDNQIAKKAGVGTGTVARYNKILFGEVYSDDNHNKYILKGLKSD